jgi:hypothetical protein
MLGMIPLSFPDESFRPHSWLDLPLSQPRLQVMLDTNVVASISRNIQDTIQLTASLQFTLIASFSGLSRSFGLG